MSNDFGIEIKKSKRFSGRRMMSMTLRIARQIKRDKRTLAMLIVMPTIITFIFGTALSGEIDNIPIAFINEDKAADIEFQISPMAPNITATFDAGTNITQALSSDERVDIQADITNLQDGLEKLNNGEISAVFFIPENFSQLLGEKQLLNGEDNPTIFMYVDASKPIIRASVVSALAEAISDGLGGQAITMDETFAYGVEEEFAGLDTAIPAVMALVLTFLVLLISLITIIREKLFGTHTRLFTTPLTKLERLLGFTIALSGVGLLMVTSVILIGVFVFGASVQGNFGLLFLSAFLYALTNVFLSIFLSNFTENELQAVQFGPLIAFPSMALSGMLVPVSSLPDIIQPVSSFIPMTYAVNIFEGIMLRGWGIEELFMDYIILIAFGLIAFLLAFLNVKDRLD